MTKITNFVWNPVDDCIISELDGTGAVQAVYTNEPQQYGGVISQRRGTTTSTYHTDALGSTRFLTDSSGNVTDTYLHDAWGNSVAATGTTVNPFKWVGKYGYYTDNSTAQVYVRARMYQPMAARWISVDPLELESAISDFLYAGSSPVVHLDPSGLIVVDRVQGTGCAGRCGAFAQPWRFSLSNGDKRWAKKHCKSDPATGKTPGYLVQEIIREAACNDDCCDSKWKPPLNLPEIDRFWEAFYIRDIETSDGPDDPQPGIPNQQGYTDAWIQPDMGASRGKSQITSHIRLYCVFGGSRPTGSLHGPNGSFQTCSQAMLQQQPNTKPCDFEKSQCPAGLLPFTRKEPKFWGPPLGGLGLQSTKFAVDISWECCGTPKTTFKMSGKITNPVDTLPSC